MAWKIAADTSIVIPARYVGKAFELYWFFALVFAASPLTRNIPTPDDD
jgi:hypothetical protein